MEEKRAKENQRARFLNAAYLIKYLFFFCRLFRFGEPERVQVMEAVQNFSVDSTVYSIALHEIRHRPYSSIPLTQFQPLHNANMLRNLMKQPHFSCKHMLTSHTFLRYLPVKTQRHPQIDDHFLCAQMIKCHQYCGVQ